MNDLQRILSYMRRAVDDYGMIAPGDRIAVGVSGGKDSLALLAGMAGLRRFYPGGFSVVAITIDMGFEGSDFSKIADFCASLDVEYRVIKTEIADIIFKARQEKNPCSLCARMRRGSLHEAAKASGCNKLALGHHNDDVVETFMLNLFFEGRIGCFSPVTYLSRADLTMIRPLIYAKEKDIAYFARKASLPVTESLCPEDKHTEREHMKELLKDWDRHYKGLHHRLFGAICKGEIDGFRLTEKEARRKDGKGVLPQEEEE